MTRGEAPNDKISCCRISRTMIRPSAETSRTTQRRPMTRSSAETTPTTRQSAETSQAMPVTRPSAETSQTTRRHPMTRPSAAETSRTTQRSPMTRPSTETSRTTQRGPMTRLYAAETSPMTHRRPMTRPSAETSRTMQSRPMTRASTETSRRPMTRPSAETSRTMTKTRSSAETSRTTQRRPMTKLSAETRGTSGATCLMTTTSRATASTLAESLTEDMIIEILLRLPVKSLLRFECVSKRWRSLISDPSFAKWHLQRLEAGDIISSQRILKTYPIATIDYKALDDDPAGIKFHSSRVEDPTWQPVLVGSCNGLVCLDVERGFILYNPTTEKFREIPNPDLYYDCTSCCGFGYDPASDDYKVVVSEGYEICEVDIFSLKSSSWRRIRLQQESHLAYDRQGVYWKGALHWCGKDKRETVIMSFDLSEEIFQQVLLVPEGNGHIIDRGLNIYGANLLMYTCNAQWSFMAWITNELGRGGSWTKLFSFSTIGMPETLVEIPLAYSRSGKVVFRLEFGELIFNTEDNTYKDFPLMSDKVAVYVETLVSPYLGCEPSRI